MTDQHPPCALSACGQPLERGHGSRYCSTDCARAASNLQQMAWHRGDVLYPPDAPTARHRCQVCGRSYLTRFRAQQGCSLACALVAEEAQS